MNRRLNLFAILIVLIAGNGLLLSQAPLEWRVAALLVVAILLPGYLLTQRLEPVRNVVVHQTRFLREKASSQSPLDQTVVHRQEYSLFGRLEQGTLIIGTGFALAVMTMLFLSYLPGGLNFVVVLVTFDLLILVLCAESNLDIRPKLFGKERATHSTLHDGIEQRNEPTQISPPAYGQSQVWLWTGVLLVLLFGAYFRFANLGYSEFQGDEARAVLRAAAVIQGYDDVLFLHRKGPTEILIPAVVYALTGQLTEATARFLFAFANLTALLALFILGTRLLGPLAGWVAAMLLSFDGYFIAFARIVQYQSIIFLMSVLVVLMLYRLATQSDHSGLRNQGPHTLRGLMLVALLFSVGLLSHYEAALVVIPGTLLLWQLRQGLENRIFFSAVLAAVVLASLLVGSFYLPFVINPTFQDTFRYLASSRVGDAFPYNNLVDFVQRTTFYSTTAYLSLLIIGTLGALTFTFRRWDSKRRWLLAILIGIGLLLFVWSPNWLQFGETDFAFAFFGITLITIGFATTHQQTNPPTNQPTLLLWLWFGLLFLLALFFVEDPRTHVYTFFIPWALLVGGTIAAGWRWINKQWPGNPSYTLGILCGIVAIFYFGNYVQAYFIDHSVERLRLWPDARLNGYWVPFDMPSEQGIFGFPLKNGWKAVEVLYQEGVLDGSYQTNTKPHVVNWYLRDGDNCFRDHKYYFFVNDHNLHLRDQQAELRKRLQTDYGLFGVVTVNGDKRLEIYQKDHGPAPIQLFEIEKYEAHFDQSLSGPNFEIAEPVVMPDVALDASMLVDFRFGDVIQLVGYRLEKQQVQPDSTVLVTLYWKALTTVENDYFVFNQIIDPETNRKQGQLDGQPDCDRRPTSTWQPGDLIVDRYRVPIFADAEPGNYPLLIGLYDRESGARLQITTADGTAVGDALTLSEVLVAE
ncbi:glycosyltransferase family 39 protein [Chloroflexi bacterium TSY]|nr:glycosyltransferase family 39 protein [Chloroflexi bacterium TSY]